MIISNKKHRKENEVEPKGSSGISVRPANRKLLAVSPSQPSFPSPLLLVSLSPVPTGTPQYAFLHQYFDSAGPVPSKRPFPCRSSNLPTTKFPQLLRTNADISCLGPVFLFFFFLHTQQVADSLQLQFNSIISKNQCD